MKITDQFEYVKLVIYNNSHTEQHFAINCSYTRQWKGADRPPYMPPFQKSHKSRNTGATFSAHLHHSISSLSFINVSTSNTYLAGNILIISKIAG